MLRLVKRLFVKVLPLSVRKPLAVLTDRLTWIPNRHSLSMAMIRDWAEQDVDAFHRFLWAHHLGYAKFYEAVHNFDTNKLLLTRRMLFEDLGKYLPLRGTSLSHTGDIRSIFDVGCSAGYLLRSMETDLFPAATTLEGIDIDGYAIEMGQAYLQAHASKIRLARADMADLDRVMDKRTFDLILCTGVLMYLHEGAAADVVRSMLNHCGGLVAITGLAHAVIDNCELQQSEPRMFDGALIHNIDAMVKKAGGAIVYRRWEGAKMFDGQPVYFIFCRPAASDCPKKPAISTDSGPSEEK
jgi:SAM-dependent methyltransferase